MQKLITFIVAVFLSASTIAQYTIHSKVDDFKLKNVNGKMVSLADFKDAKGFIVIFSCNHCPFVVATEERIMALDKTFKPKGYPVIAINPNDPKVQPEDSYNAMQKRSKEKGFTFPYLVDADQKIAKAFGATRTPHVFILTKMEDGYVVRYIGSIDDNTREAGNVKEKFVEDAIAAFERGEEPKLTETKAVGCTIKWSK
jgi:peroxiredoxin